MSSRSGRTSTVTKRIPLAAAAAAATLGLGVPRATRAAYAAYNTRDLTTAGWSEQIAQGIFGTQVVGYGMGAMPTGGVQNGLLLAGSSNQVYRMLPAPGYARSGVNGTSGRGQVGYGVTFPGEHRHAMLWDWNPALGTEATQPFVNLHPAGYTFSEAAGISGNQQVGTAQPSSGVNHAALWSGSAESFVDLHPAGFATSEARSTNGTQQVGSAMGLSTGGKHHAMLWNGTADGFVDLNPAGFDFSVANFIAGTQQVGTVANGIGSHAALWSGSADSFVDLHPADHFSSFAIATNGVQQVGAAQQALGAELRAKLWNGSAAAVLDLHSLVPGNPTDTVAQSIDVYGNIAGYADTDFGQRHAVVWWAGDAWLGSYPWASIDGWSGGQAPAAGRDVLIIPTSPSNEALAIPTGLPQFASVTVDNAGGGLAILLIDPGTALKASSSMTAGLVGRGVFKNLGGIQQTPVLRLGERAGGAGTYELGGSGELSVEALIIGQSGAGVFQQSGGTTHVASGIQLGLTQDGSGEYTLGGGTLDASSAVLNIGIEASGVFTQNGGMATLASVRLGTNPAGNGRYSLTGGSVVADTLAVGGNASSAGGTGRLDITGGQMTVTGVATIWNTPDNAVNLVGGTLSVGILNTNGNPARFNWTGGTLEITNSLPVIGPNTPLGASVTLATGKRLRIAGFAPLLRVDHSGTLAFAGGTLDLTTKKLISRTNPVGTWNGNAYTGVSGLVQSARNGGAWDGIGITTSDNRAPDNGDLVTIGVAKVGDIRNVGDNETVLFAGQHVVGADTVAMFTWGGDANLDGTINIDDYGRIDSNSAVPGANGWFNGDFNYDGKVNIDDYGIIDTNIARQNQTSLAMARVSAVPEPALLGVTALALLPLRRARRRC